MKTSQCPKLLHVKDATYKSASVLLVNVVQYVLQNVNAKRGASLMYIHFYLRVRWMRIASLADCKRIFGGKDVFIGFIIKNSNFIIFHLQILTIDNTS
jgi:hypothetical protein